MTQIENAIEFDSFTGESSDVDFKVSFDPSSLQDRCELIKDIIAMSNSGGGRILIGVQDDGGAAETDVEALLNFDPADLANQIYKYTDQHFASFKIVAGIRNGRRVAAIVIAGSRIPIVFTEHGGYQGAGGKPKTAFAKGSVYFRHGAKSEPGTTDDLRLAIERELEVHQKFWLDGIGKVMAAPEGSTVQIVQKDVRLSDSSESAPVRLTTNPLDAALSVGSVALRDVPDAAAFRLTADENAPSLNVVQADKLYPYRLKELVKRVNDRLHGIATVSGHDLQCVRKAYEVDQNQTFSYEAQHSPRKYTEAFVDWIIEQFALDDAFFHKAREQCRSRTVSDRVA